MARLDTGGVTAKLLVPGALSGSEQDHAVSSRGEDHFIFYMALRQRA